MPEIVKESGRLQRPVARTREPRQMVDAERMVQPRGERVREEQLAGHIRERDTGKSSQRRSGEEGRGPGGHAYSTVQRIGEATRAGQPAKLAGGPAAGRAVIPVRRVHLVTFRHAYHA